MNPDVIGEAKRVVRPLLLLAAALVSCWLYHEYRLLLGHLVEQVAAAFVG